MDRLKLSKTRWTRPSLQDNSINSMKIQRIEYEEQKNLKKIQTFRDSSEKPKHSKISEIFVIEFQITTIKKKKKKFIDSTEKANYQRTPGYEILKWKFKKKNEEDEEISKSKT